MFKFLIKNPHLFKSLRKFPLLKNLVFFPLSSLNNLSDERLFAEVCSLFLLNNGLRKTTERNRFEELDREMVDYILDVPIDTAIRVHDLAVSSGITSMELLNLLEQKLKKQYEAMTGHERSGQNRRLFFYISDKYSHFYWIKSASLIKVYDSDHELLHYYLGCLYADHKLAPAGFLSKILYHILVRLAPPRFNKEEARAHHLLLYHPTVLRLIKERRLYEFSYDIFEPVAHKSFTFVRAMNILNRNFFSEAEIKTAVGHIKDSLAERGLLLVGITDNHGRHNASIYRRLGEKLVLVKDIRQGYPWKHLVYRET